MPMNKSSTLKITHNGNIITIRKKPEVWVFVIFSLAFACMLILPFFLRGAWAYPVFWIVIAICGIANVIQFLRLVLGTVILDTSSQKLTVKLLWPSTCDFRSVDSVTTFFEAGDSDGGLDRNKVRIRLIHDKRILAVHTTSREQSRELVEIVESTIQQTMFPHEKISNP